MISNEYEHPGVLQDGTQLFIFSPQVFGVV